MCCLRVPLLLALSLLSFIPHPGVSGCNPGDLPPEVEEKVEFAMFVLKGKVLDHYPGRRILDGQYIASFQVDCVFKDNGTRVPGILNITNGGPNPGKCFTAQLDEGQTYIVFLRYLEPRYEANAQEIEVRDPASISRVTSSCGLKVTDPYPEGITKDTAQTTCPSSTFRACPSPTPYVTTKRVKHPQKRTTLKSKTTLKRATGPTTTATRKNKKETTNNEKSGSVRTVIYSQAWILAVIGTWLTF